MSDKCCEQSITQIANKNMLQLKKKEYPKQEEEVLILKEGLFLLHRCVGKKGKQRVTCILMCG